MKKASLFLILMAAVASSPFLTGFILAEEAPDATNTLLLETYIPPRDRMDLARRFWGLDAVPRFLEDPQPTYTVGDTRAFFVDNVDTDAQFTIAARLVYATPHAYWWLEDSYSLDMGALARSAERFEEHIYPTTRRYFGSEWSPGVDNDPHVYILLAEQLGGSVAGYYSSASEYPRAVVPNSNEAEIFLMSAPYAVGIIGTDHFDKILAHEFQHMIHWHVDTNEATWVNEGLSELAILLNGFNAVNNIPYFLVAPYTQLTTWPEDGLRAAYYGAAQLFFTHMLERFGEDAIAAVVQEDANGMVGVTRALRRVGAVDPVTGAPVDAEALFADWIVANYLNDPSAADGRYAYTLIPNLQPITPTRAYAEYPVSVEDEIWPQYAANYIQLQGQGEVAFNFKGKPFVGLLPESAAPTTGEYIYWGNRADDSDTTLTRAFDLSDVERATLKYRTWYHIEALWDYGYLTVSTDGGKTWDILETPHTTRENPHDNAYGPAYTGLSGGGERPVWIEEQVDLTPYAGQDILVRFEYITDDATLQHGFAVDDLAIPELGYFEDFESGAGGWESAGWVRHNNRLEQRFIVRLIETANDGTTRVSTLIGPDAASPNIHTTIQLDGMRDVTVVVAGIAPATTQPAAYSYTLSASGE